jgi:hypothetical protein
MKKLLFIITTLYVAMFFAACDTETPTTNSGNQFDNASGNELDTTNDNDELDSAKGDDLDSTNGDDLETTEGDEELDSTGGDEIDTAKADDDLDTASGEDLDTAKTEVDFDTTGGDDLDTAKSDDHLDTTISNDLDTAKGNYAFHGKWIQRMEVTTDYLTPDTASDTVFYSLDGSADSLSIGILEFSDTTLSLHSFENGAIAVETYPLGDISDTVIILKMDDQDYPLVYHIEDDNLFVIKGGVTVTTVSSTGVIIDTTAGRARGDTVQHESYNLYYEKYTGDIPPAEWK